MKSSTVDADTPRLEGGSRTSTSCLESQVETTKPATSTGGVVVDDNSPKEEKKYRRSQPSQFSPRCLHTTVLATSVVVSLGGIATLAWWTLDTAPTQTRARVQGVAGEDSPYCSPPWQHHGTRCYTLGHPHTTPTAVVYSEALSYCRNVEPTTLLAHSRYQGDDEFLYNLIPEIIQGFSKVQDGLWLGMTASRDNTWTLGDGTKATYLNFDPSQTTSTGQCAALTYNGTSYYWRRSLCSSENLFACYADIPATPTLTSHPARPAVGSSLTLTCTTTSPQVTRYQFIDRDTGRKMQDGPSNTHVVQDFPGVATYGCTALLSNLHIHSSSDPLTVSTSGVQSNTSTISSSTTSTTPGDDHDPKEDLEEEDREAITLVAVSVAVLFFWWFMLYWCSLQQRKGNVRGGDAQLEEAAGGREEESEAMSCETGGRGAKEEKDEGDEESKEKRKQTTVKRNSVQLRRIAINGTSIDQVVDKSSIWSPYSKKERKKMRKAKSTGIQEESTGRQTESTGRQIESTGRQTGSTGPFPNLPNVSETIARITSASNVSNKKEEGTVCDADSTKRKSESSGSQVDSTGRKPESTGSQVDSIGRKLESNGSRVDSTVCQTENTGRKTESTGRFLILPNVSEKTASKKSISSVVSKTERDTTTQTKSQTDGIVRHAESSVDIESRQ